MASERTKHLLWELATVERDLEVIGSKVNGWPVEHLVTWEWLYRFRRVRRALLHGNRAHRRDMLRLNRGSLLRHRARTASPSHPLDQVQRSA